VSDSLYSFFQSNLKSDFFYNGKPYRLYKVHNDYISLKEVMPSDNEDKAECTLHIPFNGISTIDESFISTTYKYQITIHTKLGTP
jgi:hypothetical protein